MADGLFEICRDQKAETSGLNGMIIGRGLNGMTIERGLDGMNIGCFFTGMTIERVPREKRLAIQEDKRNLMTMGSLKLVASHGKDMLQNPLAICHEAYWSMN